MRKFKFEREGIFWFAVIPEWEGEKEALQMVMGADVMLDELSNYTDQVSLLIDTQPHNNWNTLDKIMYDESTDGSYYSTDGSLKIQTIWLCPVLLFLYNEYPQTLYYHKTTNL